jgi:hypothetical protein
MSEAGTERVMATEAKLRVMSPECQRRGLGGGEVASVPLARRLGALENKTVYLVDTGFGGSYRFMQELQKWFSRNMPAVKTVRRRKSGGVFMDDTADLWEEIKARGDAAVLGVGG